MISRCIAFTDQPDSTNRAASQSSKRGVRRPLAALAEIVGRADQALAEMVLPDPVDHDAGRQRVVGARQPVGQFEPAASLGDPHRLVMLAVRTRGNPRGTVLPSRLGLPRRKTWASLKPSWRVPLGPPSCTTTAWGSLAAASSSARPARGSCSSSRDRSSAGSIACRSSAGSQNGPRAESSSS